MANAIISRADAVAQGLTSYFTGKPCLRGHIAGRNVKNGTCHACGSERGHIWYRTKRDVERNRESKRIWKENNPQKVAASRQKQKAKPPKPPTKEAKAIWAKRDYGKHKEARLARMQEYYEANRQKLIEQSAKWKQDNPDQTRETFRLCRARRRARLAGSPDQHTKADLADILRLQKHCCAYCRADLRKVRKQVDHIVPISRGGSNGRANLQYLCEPCNQKKNAQDPLDYARKRGLLL